MATIAIAGAGSIGCFVGGLLSHAGHDVRFLARARIQDAIAANGLALTDYDGLDVTLTDLDVSESPEVVADAQIVLICVKSGATAEMAAAIKPHLRGDAIIVSLQNGVFNAGVLRDALPDHQVLAGMVPFNVVPKGAAAFHKGTSGDILVQAGGLPDLSTPSVAWTAVDDIEGIQWGKLVINLGNALNALSDLPLLQQLQDRDWRRLMADQMAEALRVLKAAGIKPAKITAAPPALVPHILRLPSPLFRRVAAQMLTIDAEARSSMWDDLTQRRMTEVEALQGAIIGLSMQTGVPAPLNTRLRALIKEAETAGNGPPGLRVADIRG